jgi:hypothetical protein
VAGEIKGNGPPLDIPASELFAKLAAAKRPYEVVDFPRTDPATGEPIGKLALMPLSEEETIFAKAEATKYAKSLIKDKFDATEYIVGYEHVYIDACSCEILLRACRDLRDPHTIRVFPTATEVRKKLTSDEMAVLINMYAIVQNKLGPIVSWMSEGECDAWIKRLQEGGSELPLGLLSSEAVKALLMHSVRRLQKSTGASTLPGLPPEEPISTESV